MFAAWSGLCSDGQTVRYYEYGRPSFTAYFQILAIVETVQHGTVYGTVPSWHCQCKNGLRKASPPQTPPISTFSVLLSRIDATQCFLERP